MKGLNKSVSMKTFITALVIMAALAFGGAYAATTVFLTPGRMDEFAGIKYSMTGDVEITAITIEYNEGQDRWDILLDGTWGTGATGSGDTYDFTTTITAPGGAGASPVATSVTEPAAITDILIGTLVDYVVGDYTIMVEVTLA